MTELNEKLNISKMQMKMMRGKNHEFARTDSAGRRSSARKRF